MTKTSDYRHADTPWHPNRTFIQLNKEISLDSAFPGGNISKAELTSSTPLTIEIQGNTDVHGDMNSKYWLCFRMKGLKRDKTIKFILRNANHLRKFWGQTKYKPYMVYKEEESEWQAVANYIELCVSEKGEMIGSFSFKPERKQKNKRNPFSKSDFPSPHDSSPSPSTNTNIEELNTVNCYFSIYYPYSTDDLNAFLAKTQQSYSRTLKSNASPLPYYNQQTACYSVGRKRVPLLTITSANNIENQSEKEPIISQELFPSPKDRPVKLKNNPVIILTARVHPSETTSSYFIEGVIEYLLSNNKISNALRELFIFQIFPMLNPDGVDQGNFRFDNEMRNLNRFYGRSSIEKTPSIFAVETLLEYYKNTLNRQSEFTQFYEETYNRLFLYIDVHGHQSAKPSYIYGNHTENLHHSIENKIFCKLLENNALSSGTLFSKQDSQFSKKHMTLQQKYDEFSKQCSGRVFVGKNQINQEYRIFHSYTLEIVPYCELEISSKPKFKELKKATEEKNMTTVVDSCKALAKSVLISILDMLKLNSDSSFSEEDFQKIRNVCARQALHEINRRNLFKRSELMLSDRSAISELGKKRNEIQQEWSQSGKQYQERWFSNVYFQKNIAASQYLQSQQSLWDFIFKGKPIHNPIKKNKAKIQKDILINQIETCSNLPSEDFFQSNNLSQIFIDRNKQRTTLVAKKQTIQLREEYMPEIVCEVNPRHKTLEKHQHNKIPNAFKNNKNRQKTEPIDLYERQILQKINRSQANVKSIQLRVSHKSEPNEKQIFNGKDICIGKLKTEQKGSENNVIFKRVSEFKLNSNNYKILKNIRNSATIQEEREGEQKRQKTGSNRRGLADKMLEKIQEQRRQERLSTYKLRNKDGVKHNMKIAEARPSLRDNVVNLLDEKKLLPALKRNRVITIISDSHHHDDWVQIIKQQGRDLEKKICKSKLESITANHQNESNKKPGCGLDIKGDNLRVSQKQLNPKK